MSSVDEMKAWNANGNGLSFVITHESQDGPGFRGQTGFMASWRSDHESSNASIVVGSPFETYGEAENACKALATLLADKRPSGRGIPRINFDVPAILRKWPSLGNERRSERSPYMLLEGTLDECLRDLLAKPISGRHLYDICVASRSAAQSAVLPARLIAELARLNKLR